MTAPRMIAALYVAKGGCYFGLEGVDPWDEARDARLYAGPWPVVAHPPCERWGRYWHGGPSARVRRKLGDDDGCFSAALASVNRWGGVLEHPEGSHAWRAFNLVAPPRDGGWVSAGLFHPGHTCCVEQGHYGHRARKATWLYAAHVELPRLQWGQCESRARLDDGYHSAEERRLATQAGSARSIGERGRRLTRFECMATPPAFRDILISMARSATGTVEPPVT